jgi:hypothetical protein
VRRSHIIPQEARIAKQKPPESRRNDWARLLLRWLGIDPKIARRKVEHGSGLGKTRWVVERTICMDQRTKAYACSL